MTHLRGKERSRFVRRMFGRIAQSYDRLNRIMTLGQDKKWRKEAAQVLALPPDATILDLGSGTGDMLFEIRKQYPQSNVVGVDFTPEMIQIGHNRKELAGISWVIADAHNLPFQDSSFDGTISAFLMRNLSEVGPVFAEQHRVLSDQGRLVCLETTPLKRNLLNILTHFYLSKIIPFMGRLISQDVNAYTYLAQSMNGFIEPENVAEELSSLGFREVHFIRRMFGTIAIHIARKA